MRYWQKHLLRSFILALLLALLLTGCRAPQSPPAGPGAGGGPEKSAPPAPAPGEQPAAPAAKNPPVESSQPAPGVAAPSFKGKELATGKEIAFPEASAGRVAVLSFFSPG